MRIFSIAGLFLAVLLCNGIFLQSCLGSGSTSTIICIEQERQALLKFKQSLTNTTGRLSSWTGEDCCNWEGIQCDRNTSHVVELDLVSLDPDAPTIEANEVNPSLLELKYLKHLDLSGNNFHAIQIPIFFGSMTSLRYLNLSYSSFSGRVPHHLGNVSKLMVLDLSGIYSLTIDDFSWVYRLSSLQFLDASGVHLSQVLNLNGVLNRLPSLTDLRLSECDLNSTLLVSAFHLNSSTSNIRNLDLSYNHLNSSFPFYLENLKSLEHLNLGANLFTDVVGLSRLLLSQCNLKSLDMSQNQFHGQMSRSYGNLSRCAMYNLEMLILSRNEITGDLPDWLGQFKHLKHLDLSMNELNGTIPVSLGQLSNLKILDFSYNHLGVVTEANFANLTSLEELSIDYNFLTLKVTSDWMPPFQLKSLGMGPCKIGTGFPKWLQTQKKLSSLKISYASISGTLPQWLYEMPLVHLDLSQNNISGPIEKLPSTLEELDLSNNSISGPIQNLPSTLKGLYLSDNLITGPLPQNISEMLPNLVALHLDVNSISGLIPYSLWEIPSLGFLNLSNNGLSGPIPRLPSTLIRLDLSDNSITGPLPQNISEMLPNLVALYLDGNMISGLIPYSLWEIPSLGILDLSNNRLSGNLPHYKGWGALGLWVMRLSSNNLSGILPSSVGNLTVLDMLQLNDNNFYGELPLTLRNCSVLRILDLGENGFSGSIPRWIDDLPLSVLRLHQNMFSGRIPSQLCRMSELQIMDFGDNLLLGPIPPCFGNLSRMKDHQDEYYIFGISMKQVIKGRGLEFTTTLDFLANMDLSWNNLVGSIPKEITNLSGLQGLNLSHNHLTGKIPENISGLKSLESLDLSMNQLSGIIPQSISALNYLSCLNLSYNNLSGRIPTGNQLQTLDDPSSSYRGNNELCGVPLPRNCPGDEKSQPPITTSHREEREGVDSENFWFYMAIISGYATGLWGVIGVLVLKKTWRYACFQFVEMVNDKVLVAIALGVARLKNYINQFGG